jgi:hypothetical protein
MTREDITRMAREAGFVGFDGDNGSLRRFAALVAAAERNKVASWMMAQGYATGHGDTTEDLLQELEWQIAENWTRGMVNGVQAEREACAMECIKLAHDWARLGAWGENNEFHDCAAAIRARGQA